MPARYLRTRYLRAGGRPIQLTKHFQYQWKMRVGGPIELPLGRIARSVGRQGRGAYEVHVNDLVLVAHRMGHLVALVTVWKDAPSPFAVLKTA